MKRTYIKPFMESEEFVTNEYVAACWLVTCDTDGINFITHEEPNPDLLDANQDGYTWGYGYDSTPIVGSYYYSNKNNEFTHQPHGNLGWDSYKVTINEVKQAGILSDGEKYGPNAS